MANMTEDEAKAERKRQQEVEDAAVRMLRHGGFRVEAVILSALGELHAMRENLASTQARSTQLIDESRAMRRVLLELERELRLQALHVSTREAGLVLMGLTAIAEDAAKEPPCT